MKPIEENQGSSEGEFQMNRTIRADSEIKSGKWSLELSVEPSFAPKSHLVVYHLVNDKEIVASSIQLKIKSCFKHKVPLQFQRFSSFLFTIKCIFIFKLNDNICMNFKFKKKCPSKKFEVHIFDLWNAFNVETSINIWCPIHKTQVQTKFVEKHAQPGEAVTLALSTSSKSLCALSGVDRAVTFLDKNRALSSEEIFERLETFNERKEYSNHDYQVDKCSHGGYRNKYHKNLLNF